MEIRGSGMVISTTWSGDPKERAHLVEMLVFKPTREAAFWCAALLAAMHPDGLTPTRRSAPAFVAPDCSCGTSVVPNLLSRWREFI